MKLRMILVLSLVAAAGCGGMGSDPTGEHELAVGLAATVDDVHDLGIDEGGCRDAVGPGVYPVPVRGRPDLVGMAIDESVICVTTVEAATAFGLDVSSIVVAGAIAVDGERSEPDPEPYVRAEGGGAASEPDPLPYLEKMSGEPEGEAHGEEHEGDEAEEPDPLPY